MKNITLVTILVIVILGLSSFIPAQAQVQQNIGSGSVDWELGVIRVVGIGAPPPNAVNKGQARAMALRAAQADGYRNLLEVTKGVRVTSTTTVKNFVEMNDTIRTQVEGIVKGAQVVDQKYLSDGSVEVTLEMPMYGRKGLSVAIYNAQKKDFETDLGSKKNIPKQSDAQKKLQEQLDADRKAREEAEKRAMEAKKKAAAEAEAKRKAEEEMKRFQAEEKRRQEELAARKAREEAEKKALAEQMKKQEEERKRLEMERLAAEKKQREAEEAAKKAQEAEARKKAEEAARIAAEEAKANEAARIKAEEEAKRLQEQEMKRKAEEDAARKAAELEQKQREEELKRLEEAQRKAEEEKRKAEEEAARKAKEAEVRKKAEEEKQKELNDSGAYDAKIGDVSAFTGIIIDSSAVGAKPAMSPKVLIQPPPTPEKEVYSMAEAKYEVALNFGLVGYARSIDSAQKQARIGSNPMIIKAVGVSSGKPSDIQIKYDDGMRLVKLDQEKKILENCKVVMVLSSKKSNAALFDGTIQLALLLRSE